MRRWQTRDGQRWRRRFHAAGEHESLIVLHVYWQGSGRLRLPQERRARREALQTMRFVKEFQIELPDEFPAVEYHDYWEAASAVLHDPHKGAAWAEFAGASNLIGWRFRSCFEAMSWYLDSWHARGYDAKHEEIYQREARLFTMFTSGVSSLESTVYSLYAVASHPKVLGVAFGVDEQRHAGVKTLQSALGNAAQAQPLASGLSVILGAPEWERWVEFRNRMTHRSNLPRIIKASVGSAPPPGKTLDFAATSSTAAFSGDEHDLVSLYDWLAAKLRELVVAGTALAKGV